VLCAITFLVSIVVWLWPETGLQTGVHQIATATGAGATAMNINNSTVTTIKQERGKRIISPEQRARLKTILSPYAGATIDVVPSEGDTEAILFARQLESVFSEAGWRIEDGGYARSFGIALGVVVRYPTNEKSNVVIGGGKCYPSGKIEAAATAIKIVEPSVMLEEYPALKPHQIELRIGSMP